MISNQDLDRVTDSTVYGAEGDKIGSVGQVYLDDQTGNPSWVTVKTGLFGTSETFVPLEGASFDDGDLRVAHSKDKIKDAPRVDADRHLDRDEEDDLYRYYGLGGDSTDLGESRTEAGYAGDIDDRVHTEDRHETDLRGTTGDEATTVLHEEQLKVGTESHEAGRVRLRKYTTTETEQISVPVTKEKLTVERQPVEGDAVSSEPIAETDEVEEITLREERPVVDKETVAVEEVSVGKERVTETEQVQGEVRREHADLDVEGEGIHSDADALRGDDAMTGGSDDRLR